MTIAAVIQARLGSTRLPGKVLKPFCGSTVMGYLYQRLRKAKMLDNVIVATTDNPNDDRLAAYLDDAGIPFFRGAEENCLERMYKCCTQFKVDIVVRITSDCPLTPPDMVDDMVRYFLRNRKTVNYLSNRQHSNFPEGLDTEIFPASMLEDAFRNAAAPEEKEHINYYFLSRPEKYQIRYYNHPGDDYSGFHLSIDTAENYRYAVELFENNGLSRDFSLNDLLNNLHRG